MVFADGKYLQTTLDAPMKKALLTLLFGFSFIGAVQAAYMPIGPQTNIALSTVLNGGWTQCYSATMAAPIGINASQVLSECTGDNLMMAGRETGSDSFLVLAAGDLVSTIFDTGNTNNTHVVNGSKWWFSGNEWSWGFTGLNNSVQNNSCNLASGPTSMCLHTYDQYGGYRINDIGGLNDSIQYEKVFFVSSAVDPVNVPEPTSIALLGLGLFGFAAVRRKSAK